MKIPCTHLQRRALCFSSNRNSELKVKVWWVGACRRKKVYWINFQNIYTFTYQKILLHTLFCFFLKWLKAFSVSLPAKPMELLKNSRKKSGFRNDWALARRRIHYLPDGSTNHVLSKIEHKWYVFELWKKNLAYIPFLSLYFCFYFIYGGNYQHKQFCRSNFIILFPFNDIAPLTSWFDLKFRYFFLLWR